MLWIITMEIDSLVEHVRIIGQTDNNFTSGVIATMLAYKEPSAMMTEDQGVIATMEQGVIATMLEYKTKIGTFVPSDDEQTATLDYKTKIGVSAIPSDTEQTQIYAKTKVGT